MKYFLPLVEQQDFGRMAIYDAHQHPLYIALGKFSQASGTIFLTDLEHHDCGRISVNRDQLGTHFTILLPGQDSLQVTRLKLFNLVYYRVPAVHYTVLGQQKKSNFKFYQQTHQIAQAKLIVTDSGPTMLLETAAAAQQELLILLTLIFIQPDFWTLKLDLKTKRYVFQPTF